MVESLRPDGMTAGVPRVTEVGLTAIKGFRLDRPESVTLTAAGALGNRDFLVVDARDELLSVTASGAFLPYWSRFDARSGMLDVGRDGATVLAAQVQLGEPLRAHLFGDRYVDAVRVTGPWDRFLSDLAGTPVRLVKTRDPSGGYDVHPVTLVSQASVAALGEEADGSRIDGRRFRMLLTCDGLEPFGEDAWAGRQVVVGSAVLEMGGPVPRCAAVQRHPDHPDRPLDALRRIARIRGPRTSASGRTLDLGVYARVVEPGVISVDDPLLLRTRGPESGPRQPE